MADDRTTIARRRVVAVCWNDPANNAPAAAALGRRVRQVTTALASAGWAVDVLFRASTPAQASEPIVRHGSATRVIAVPGPGLEPSPAERLPMVRMMATYWYARMLGDRSGRWAHAATQVLDLDRRDGRPAALIAFFTPRGPLAAAAGAHRSLGIPWIADLQDPIDEGASPVTRPAVVAWMRKTLRTASRVVQVSPEWAAASSKSLNRPVEVLRHAVPNLDGPCVSRGARDMRRPLILLYAGSLNFEFQSAVPLLLAMDLVNREQASAGHRGVVLRLATTRDAFERLRALAAPEKADTIQFAGWLSQSDLGDEMDAADALVLIPWSRNDRQVVPSKLYEYLGYQKPILVAGRDSGGVRALLHDVQHPDVIAERAEDIADVIRAMIRGEDYGALMLEKCGARPTFESDIRRQYVAWIDELTAGLNA